MAAKRTRSTVQPVDILRDTKALLQQIGWIQGDYVGPEGMCLLRALRSIGRPGDWNRGDPGPYVAAMMHLSRALPPSFPGGLGSFNDHPRTTLGSVMALFDRAIAAAA